MMTRLIQCYSVSYLRLKHDPERQVHQQLKSLNDRGELSSEIYKRLNPCHTRLPYFYRLPKIHKEQVPLRPIVRTIGSPTYALAKHLATILSPIVGQTPSHIRNSKHFVELMKDQRISDSDIMISFDVSSLFTNVPILETLDYLKQKLEEDST